MSSDEFEVIEPAAPFLYESHLNFHARDDARNRDMLFIPVLDDVLAGYIRDLKILVPDGDVFDFGGGSRASAVRFLTGIDVFNKVNRKYISVDYGNPAEDFDSATLLSNIEAIFNKDAFKYLVEQVKPNQLAVFMAMNVVEFFTNGGDGNWGALAYHLATKLKLGGIFVNTFNQGNILDLNTKLEPYKRKLVKL